jgi:mRNA interferase MazF
LVVSVSAADSDRSLVTLVPHTTSVWGSRFEVSQLVPFLKSGASDAQALVTIPQARLIRRLGVLQPSQLAPIEPALMRWLGLGARAS